MPCRKKWEDIRTWKIPLFPGERLFQMEGARGGRMMKGGFCAFNVGGFLVYWVKRIG